MATDPAADFLRCLDVLDGRPAPAPRSGSHKLLRFLTTSRGDLRFSRSGVAWITLGGRQHRYVSDIGPPLLATLLRAGALPCPVHSAAARIPGDAGLMYRREESAVWFLRAPDEIRLLFRDPPGPIDAPLVPIPQQGPWALPPLAVIGVPPAERRYVENTGGRPCPRCGEAPERFRDLGDRWVCGGCARSFEAPA